MSAPAEMPPHFAPDIPPHIAKRYRAGAACSSCIALAATVTSIAINITILAVSPTSLTAYKYCLIGTSLAQGSLFLTYILSKKLQGKPAPKKQQIITLVMSVILPLSLLSVAALGAGGVLSMKTVAHIQLGILGSGYGHLMLISSSCCMKHHCLGGQKHPPHPSRAPQSPGEARS